MKRIIWVILLLTLTIIGSAQNRKSYKGPLSKNHKLWKLKSSPKSSLTRSAKSDKPTTENDDIIKKRYSVREIYRKRSSRSKIKSKPLRGPRAKNYKPWTNKRPQQIKKRQE